MTNNIKLATRKSPLALIQDNMVKDFLIQNGVFSKIELISMSTSGDTLDNETFKKEGGKGLFLKELESALLKGQADIAVHSMKDVPMEFPEGLEQAVICEREDPLDAFVSNHYQNLDQLPDGSVVGTSSLRRQCQVRANFPNLQIKELRGNVNTRLGKLDSGEYDAIILASAGLIRLEMAHRITSKLDSQQSLPAGGQGAVGIECRVDDQAIQSLLAQLHHRDTASCVLAERAVNRHLQGGCQVPIACFAELDSHGQTIALRGLVGSVDGATILRANIEGARENAEALGVQLAEQLLAAGAGDILAEVYEL